MTVILYGPLVLFGFFNTTISDLLKSTALQFGSSFGEIHWLQFEFS